MRQITSDVGNETRPYWSPDGQWIAFSGQNLIKRMRPSGDDLEQLVSNSVGQYARWSPDVRLLYSAQPVGELGELSLESRQVRQVAGLTGRPGELGALGLAVGDGHLYFMWEDSERDIWAMDVVLDE